MTYGSTYGVSLCRVEKTTVYLPEGLLLRVKHLAMRKRVSEASVIRAALEHYTTVERPRPRDSALRDGPAHRRLGRRSAGLRRAVIVVDTSGVFAALDRSQSDHEACGAVLEGDEPLVLSPFVLAELDYLLATRVSAVASVELLRDVEAGAFELASFGADDVGTAATIVDRFVDLADRARGCLDPGTG